MRGNQPLVLDLWIFALIVVMVVCSAELIYGDQGPPQAPCVPQAPPMIVKTSVRSKTIAKKSYRSVKKNIKKQKRTACPCSNACACGCNEGKPCDCARFTRLRQNGASGFSPWAGGGRGLSYPLTQPVYYHLPSSSGFRQGYGTPIMGAVPAYRPMIFSGAYSGSAGFSRGGGGGC